MYRVYKVQYMSFNVDFPLFYLTFKNINLNLIILGAIFLAIPITFGILFE